MTGTSMTTPAQRAAIRWQVRTGRYRVAPALVAKALLHERRVIMELVTRTTRTETGRRPESLPRKEDLPEVFPKGRTCATEACGTILNHYNGGDRCHACEPGSIVDPDSTLADADDFEGEDLYHFAVIINRSKPPVTAVVDYRDRGIAGLRRWRRSPSGYIYCATSVGGRPVTLYLHREIAGLTPGDGLEVDHINNDRLDNRRSNLRVLTHAQNRQ